LNSDSATVNNKNVKPSEKYILYFELFILLILMAYLGWKI